MQKRGCIRRSDPSITFCTPPIDIAAKPTTAMAFSSPMGGHIRAQVQISFRKLANIAAFVWTCSLSYIELSIGRLTVDTFLNDITSYLLGKSLLAPGEDFWVDL